MIINRWMSILTGIVLISGVAAQTQASAENAAPSYPLTHNRTIVQMHAQIAHEKQERHLLKEKIVILKARHDYRGAARAEQQLKSRTSDIAGLQSELHDAMTNGNHYQSKRH